MAPIPAKAKPEVQEQFLAEEWNPVLEEAKHGKRHVFFVDASHLVFAAFLGSLWCFTRKDPRIVPKTAEPVPQAWSPN